ncbi:MAG: hypothetical protein AAF436_02495 [Myxococcota bacterium]
MATARGCEPLAKTVGEPQTGVVSQVGQSAVFVLIVMSMIDGCSRAGTPMRVAESFYEEMAAGNIEAAGKLSTPETAEMLPRIAAMHDIRMFEVIAKGGASDELIEGENALVTFEEGGGYATVPLVMLHGEWKVDFATMMKGAMPSSPVPQTL